MRFVRTAENLFGLPQGFTRVEYLQSTGAQYIDTGVIGNGEFDVDYMYYQTQDSSNAIFAGTRSSSQHLNFGQRSNGSSGVFSMAYLGEYWQAISSPAINTKIRVQISYKSGSQTGYLNGVAMTGKTLVGTEETNLSIYVFKRNHYGTDNVSGLVGRIYYFKLWKDGVLVRDFIPCIDALGVPCMYDLVGKKPYYNQGTGTFTTGRQIIPVEYLEAFSGTNVAYIATNLKPTVNTNFETKVRYNDASSTRNTWALGATTWWGVHKLGDSGQIGITNSSGASSKAYANYTYGTDVTLKLDGSNVYVDGNLIGSITKTNATSTIDLFRYYNGSNLWWNGRIYYFKADENGTPVCNFIPCKDENNVGFMFDKVSGTCYLNAGTGAFSVGENKYTSKLRLIRDAKELPTGYKRVEYIASSGTQYIDTGFIPTENTRTIASLFTTSTANKNWFGSNGDSQVTKGCYCFNAFSATQIEYLFGNVRWARANAAVVNKVFKVDFSKNGIYVDNELVATPSYTDFGTGDRTMTLFVRNGGTAYISGKIYYLKMYENGTLVRSFIPVRDSNNVGYMYDEVTGQFFGNAGSGSFGVGNDLPTAKVRFIRDVIPSAYLPLNYLESTGTQYIDTGIQPTDTYGYRIKNTYTAGAGEQCAIGCMDSGNRFVGIYTSGSASAISGAWGSFVNFLPSYTWTTGTILDVKCNYKNSRKMVIDNTEMKDISDTHISGTISNTLYLFARHYGSTITKMNGKVYGAQVTNGQDLVLDLYPVLRKSDNKPGMYDRITKQFFVNQGTGEFNYG